MKLRRRSVSALVCLIAMAFAPPLDAQSASGNDPVLARGRVVDKVTGTPVRGAEVRQEQGGALAVSDSLGLFAIRLNGTFPATLTVEHLGYWDLSFDLAAGDERRSLRVELAPRALALEEISVPILSDQTVLYREGLAKTEAKLKTRRGFSGGRVRVIDQATMLETETASVGRFLWYRSPHWTLCRSSRSSYCVGRNGRQRPVVVCIDEVYAIGGVRELEGVPPSELHSVEIYGLLGSEVRAYTTAFMDRAAKLGGITFRPRQFMGSPC